MDVLFLTTEDALEIHRHVIERYGGGLGLRDPGLLDSALHQPSAMAFGEFLHKDLCEMAAAYLFSIVKNHPFLDGNKRAGAAIANTFLELNGLEVTADEVAFEQLVLNVAKGEADKFRVVEFFRCHTAPLSPDALDRGEDAR